MISDAVLYAKKYKSQPNKRLALTIQKLKYDLVHQFNASIDETCQIISFQ